MALSFRKGTDINDWTYATGDLPRTRGALIDFEGHVQLRSLSSPDTTSELFTSPRKVSALIRFSPGGRWLAIRHRDELGIWDTTPGATQPLAFVCKPWGRENPFGFMKMCFAPDDGSHLAGWSVHSGDGIARRHGNGPVESPRRGKGPRLCSGF